MDRITAPSIGVITAAGPGSEEALAETAYSVAIQHDIAQWAIVNDRVPLPRITEIAEASGAASSTTVVIIPTPSPGNLAAGRNQAVKQLTTQWVLPLDAGDVLETGVSGVWSRYAEMNPGTAWIAGVGAELPARPGDEPTYRPDRKLARRLAGPMDASVLYRMAREMGDAPILSSGAILMRATTVRSLGGWDEELASFFEDVSLVATITSLYSGVLIDDLVVHRRFGNGQDARLLTLPNDETSALASRLIADRAEGRRILPPL